MKDLNNDILNEIYRIADNLIEISFQNNESATWLNIVSGTSSDKNFNFIEESNFSLLNGILGDMLFFFTFSKTVNDVKYSEFAYKIHINFTDYLENINLQKIDSGLLSGLGGIIYGLIKIYEITNDNKFLIELESILAKIDIKNIIYCDEYNSIVRGNSGLLISLCKYHKYAYDKKKNINLINECCEILISRSNSSSNGVFWLPQHHKKPLAGVAHGSSGYALAFHEAYRITQKKSYMNIVKKNIFFENTLFIKEIDNWIDNRDFIPDEIKGHTFAWSHGAPGIGLIRNKLLASNLYDSNFSKILSDDVNISIQKTIISSFIDNKDVLIYGKLGNIDLLINTSNNYRVQNQLKEMLEKCKAHGWDYGYKLKMFYKPGFFNGSSGIGYQLLRFIDDKIPSILSFE